MPATPPPVYAQITTSEAVYRGTITEPSLREDTPWIEIANAEQWDDEERGYFPLRPKFGEGAADVQVHRDRVLSVLRLAQPDRADAPQERRWPLLLDALEEFFGHKLLAPRLLKDEVPKRDLVNLDIAIAAVMKRGGGEAQILGYGEDRMLSNAIAGATTEGRTVKVSPPAWERRSTSIDEERDCVVSGVRLFHYDGHPVAFAVNAANPYSIHEVAKFEVLATEVEVARRVLNDIRDHMTSHNTYRGKVIALRTSGLDTEIEFQEVTAPASEDIVLPAEVLEGIHRCVFGVPKHRDALKTSRHHLSRGLLFHGRPGTGKTLMVRHLIGQLTGHTVVLLTGASQGNLDEAVRMAKLLSPSVVVIEDADLIARDREASARPDILHDLMDHMDGLTPTTEVLFLLTTNQPEVIEDALAGRPGRIDHAVEFPVPDAKHRRRLFDLYAREATVEADIDHVIQNTDGATGAFLRELLRRAFINSCEAGEQTIRDPHLKRALHGLLESGNDLTPRFLGFHKRE